MLNNNNNNEITSLLPAIRATVAKVIGASRPDMIDDVVSDTVVKLLSGGLDRCDGRASLKTWATITAKNTALDAIGHSRCKRGHDTIDQDSDSDEGAAAPIQLVSGVASQERALEASRLLAAIDALEASERTMMLAIADGATPTEAGRLVGLGHSQAARKVASLREQLKG